MCLATPEESFWSEKKVSVNDARRELGCDKAQSTVAGWVTDGFRSPVTGEVVQLEGCYVGRELYTSKAAYERFLKKINGFKAGE